MCVALSVSLNSKFNDTTSFWQMSKDSFLRALRKVASEMKLFLENHGQYTKGLQSPLVYGVKLL